MCIMRYREIYDLGGFMVAQELDEVGIEMLPNLTEFQEELMKQTWQNMIFQTQQGLNNRWP